MIIVEFHEDAKMEIRDAMLFYNIRVQGLGVKLLCEVENSTQKIANDPYAGSVVGKEIRCRLLRRFPYKLMYEIQPDRVWIIAFAHQKRRPGYWKYRQN